MAIMTQTTAFAKPFFCEAVFTRASQRQCSAVHMLGLLPQYVFTLVRVFFMWYDIGHVGDWVGTMG